MPPTPRLDGRTALIVGGTGGIGLATARRFLGEGARVVVSGRTPGEAEAAIQHLGGPPGAFGVTGDITAVGAAERLVDEAVARLGGRLDILVHVAGISGRRFGDGPLHECTDEGWDAVMAANAHGLFLTNRAAVRQMLAQPLDEAGQRGCVLNVGSVLSFSPSPHLFGTIAYAASKGAATSLTLSAAARYAGDRIRFNMIAPGLIDTPMAARATQDAAILAYLAAKQPLAAGPGSPDDCAEAALYLCQPASRFLTGVVLPVDGGWHIAEGRP